MDTTHRIVQKQSQTIRYKYWQTIRQKQINRIKQNIRKLYAVQQQQQYNKKQIHTHTHTNQDTNQQYSIRYAVQQFRNKLKLDRVCVDCRVCQLGMQMGVQCIKYIRYNNILCMVHQKQIIDRTVVQFIHNPQHITILYNNYQLQQQNIVQIKRTLQLICCILLHTQWQVHRQILYNFCIVGLIVQGWYQYWIQEHLHSCGGSSGEVSRIRYLLMEGVRLIILRRLLRMDDGNGWKIIQFYITSNDIFNKIIGYDWIIWVLGNEPKYESQQMNRIQGILFNIVYKRNIINDMEFSSQVLQLQIQICQKCLCIRLGNQNRNKYEDTGYMQEVGNWMQIIQKQINTNKNIVKFSQYTYQSISNIRQAIQYYTLNHNHNYNQYINTQDKHEMDIQFK